MGTNTPNPHDITISTAVDTDKLWGKPYPNTPEADIDECTFISDGISISRWGQPSKTFETEVYRGKKVTWTIASQNVSRVYVQLVSVTHNPTRGNPNFFDHNPLNVGRQGSVEGTIMNVGNLPDENYTIHFKLISGSTERNYIIDPKLKISTRQ